jgi:CspA family cold shock protein
MSGARGLLRADLAIEPFRPHVSSLDLCRAPPLSSASLRRIARLRNQPVFRRHGLGAHVGVGVVKFFNNQKGFGFIAPNDGSRDVFVHVSAVEESGLPGLSEGQRVSYELARDGKGRDSAVKLVKR